jgi:acylglycerol lipase
MTSAIYTEAWLPGFDGHQFYTRTWSASEPKAAMRYVHGFADHISRYDYVHRRWSERGITLFAYDLRGFGRTALDAAHKSSSAAYGRTTRALELQDLEWWTLHVATSHPALPIFMMGYSAVSPTRCSLLNMPG